MIGLVFTDCMTSLFRQSMKLSTNTILVQGCYYGDTLLYIAKSLAVIGIKPTLDARYSFCHYKADWHNTYLCTCSIYND